MATANLSWTPGSAIWKQHVWYGKTADVGTTLPPSTGWIQHTPVVAGIGPLVTMRQIRNLDQSTSYKFAVVSQCIEENDANPLSDYTIISGTTPA